MLVLVYEYLPYMVLCLYTSLEGIPDNLVHASRVLGASPARTFLNVVFPLSIPGLLSGILLVLIPVCGSFAESRARRRAERHDDRLSHQLAV